MDSSPPLYVGMLQESATFHFFPLSFFLALFLGVWNFCDQGSNLRTRWWKYGVSTAGPPGKSESTILFCLSFYFLHWFIPLASYVIIFFLMTLKSLAFTPNFSLGPLRQCMSFQPTIHTLKKRKAKSNVQEKIPLENKMKVTAYFLHLPSGFTSLESWHILLLLLSRFSRVRFCATP